MVPQGAFFPSSAERAPAAACRERRQLEAARAHFAEHTARRTLRAWAQRSAHRRAHAFVMHVLKEASWCAVTTLHVPGSAGGVGA